MKSFTIKSVAVHATLGEKLRQLRNEAQLSLEEFATRSGIQRKYVVALEAGRYDRLPGDVYVRNFLRRYADLLQVNPARVYELYERERRVVRPPGATSVKPPHALSEPHAPNIPVLARKLAIAASVLTLLVYLAVKVYTIVTPPTLQILSPAEDLVTSELSVRIEGFTEGASAVRINGQPIFTDPTGHFSERIDLQPGLNVIKIAANKQRSKEQVVYRSIIVKTATDGDQQS